MKTKIAIMSLVVFIISTLTACALPPEISEIITDVIEQANAYTNDNTANKNNKETNKNESNAQDNNDTSNDDNKTNIEPHTHEYGSWVTTKVATCTEDGISTRTCDCGEKETNTISALGHNEVIDDAVEKTCTTQGLTEGSHCETCDLILTKQEIIDASHNSPHGVCLDCLKVTNSREAIAEYVTVKSNARNSYFTYYMNGTPFVTYAFYTYDIKTNFSNTVYGKPYVSIYLDLMGDEVSYSSYYRGTGFVDCTIKCNGRVIESSTKIVDNAYVTIDCLLLLDEIEPLVFEIYIQNSY